MAVVSLPWIEARAVCTPALAPTERHRRSRSFLVQLIGETEPAAAAAAAASWIPPFPFPDVLSTR